LNRVSLIEGKQFLKFKAKLRKEERDAAELVKRTHA
jgi:hypothetical protein